MRGNVIDYGQARRISKHTFERWTRRLLPLEGDLLFAREAPVGPIVRIPRSENVAPGQRTVLMRPNPDLVDSRFLYYLLSSPQEQDRIQALAAGSTVAHLNVADIRSLEINVPTLEIQGAIAEVLGALDDKIAANTKLSEMIDASLRLQYQHAMQKPEPAPRPLLEVFAVQFGEAFKGENFSEPGSGRPLIRIRDLKTYTSQVWTTESRTKETLVTPGDVLVGMDAEFRPTTWLGEPGMLNQRVCRVKSKFGGPAFVREALRKPLDTIENYKTGTTVIHLNKKDLEDNSINIPEADALRAFNESTESLYATRVALAKESRILSATRDVLLPQLMSGKLKIKQAEEIVASAV